MTYEEFKRRLEGFKTGGGSLFNKVEKGAFGAGAIWAYHLLEEESTAKREDWMPSINPETCDEDDEDAK